MSKTSKPLSLAPRTDMYPQRSELLQTQNSNALPWFDSTLDTCKHLVSETFTDVAIFGNGGGIAVQERGSDITQDNQHTK